MTFAIVLDKDRNNVLVGGVASRAEYALTCSKPEWGKESGKLLFPLLNAYGGRGSSLNPLFLIFFSTPPPPS